MFNLPKPKLGDVTAITIASPDLDASFEYYKRLGFNELFRSDFPFPFIQISDGQLQIMLRKGDATYIALSYYVKDIDKVVAEPRTAPEHAHQPNDPSSRADYFICQSIAHTFAGRCDSNRHTRWRGPDSSGRRIESRNR